MMFGNAEPPREVRRILEALEQPDWTNIAAFSRQVEAPLRALGSDPEHLLWLIDRARRTPRLRAMAERFDYISQIVLSDELKAGYRLRLHIYGDVQHDWPHNHRWPLANLLLHGRLTQSAYDPCVIDQCEGGARNLRPVIVTERRAGDFYALREDVVDVVLGAPGSIALLVRGPAVRDEFIMFDRGADRWWTRRGAAQESRAELAAKVIPEAVFDTLFDHVRKSLHRHA